MPVTNPVTAGYAKSNSIGKTSPVRDRACAGSYPLVITNLGYVTRVQDPCNTNRPLLMNFARATSSQQHASDNYPVPVEQPPILPPFTEDVE
jgi:hypothetical protein